MGSQAVRRPAAAILLVAIGGVWASNGTASALSCTVSDESMIVRFEGTYLGLAPGEQATVIPEPPIHRFETAAGEVIDVQLFGPVWTLEEGGDYAVPAMRDGEAGLDAAVPDYEWCGPLITRIDGSAIETGPGERFFGWWPPWTTVFVVGAVLVAPVFLLAFLGRSRRPRIT